MKFALWTLAVAGSALVITQSSITKPFRDWLGRRTLPPWRFAAKLISCPMCSGFWLGLGWSLLFGVRGVDAAAHGFGGGIVSALAVSTWLALGEAYAALGLWRYLNAEPPPPEGVCRERMRLAFRSGVGNPLSVVCPRHFAERNGQPCFPGKGET